MYPYYTLWFLTDCTVFGIIYFYKLAGLVENKPGVLQRLNQDSRTDREYKYDMLL